MIFCLKVGGECIDRCRDRLAFLNRVQLSFLSHHGVLYPDLVRLQIKISGKALLDLSSRSVFSFVFRRKTADFNECRANLMECSRKVD